MNQTTTQSTSKAPVIPGPTLAELQCNPIPESFYQLTGELPYRMLNDALFHIVMEANPEVLKSLICALLDIAPKNISSIEVTNPIELGSNIYSKKYILDLRILLNSNTLINIEVQVLKLKFWKERSLVYLCRTFDNLNKGDDYHDVNAASHIGILDFDIFPNDTEFYATYHLANDITHKIYSDKFRLSVLQLNQIEHATELDIVSKRVLWAKFFKATTWREVHMLAQQDPIILEAAKTLYRVTEDERVRLHCEALEEGERTYRTLAIEVAEQLQEIDKQSKQLDAQRKQLDEQNKQLDEQNKQLDEQNKQLDEQNKQLDEQNKQLDEQNKQLDAQRKQLQEFHQEFKNKIQRKIAKGKSLEQIAEELEEDIENIRPLYNELITK